LLAKIEPFALLGKSALLRDSSRSANAVANEETKLCYFFREDLLQLFLNKPQMGIRFYEAALKMFSERLDVAHEELFKRK